MYAISEQLLKDIKNPSRDIDIKVYIDGVELGKEEIESLEVEYSLGNNGVPAFGGVSSTMMTLNLLKVGNTPQLFNARKVEPYAGIYDSLRELHWIPLGIFYPNKKDITNTKSGLEIVAFDKISEIDNKKYDSKLIDYVDIKLVVQEIAWYLEVDIKNISVLPDLSYKISTGKSARVILSEIAQLTGFNCFINRFGELEFKKFKQVDFRLSAENTISFTVQSDEPIVVSKLIAKDGTGKQIQYGDESGNSIELTTKKATEEILKAIHESMIKVYVPYEIECQGMPHIECGDIISFTNVDGSETELLIAEHKITITGGLISEFSCQAISSGGYKLGTLDDEYNEKLYGNVEDKLSGFKDIKYSLEFGTVMYNSNTEVKISFFFTQAYKQEPVFMFQLNNNYLSAIIEPIMNDEGYYGGIIKISNNSETIISCIIPITAYCALPVNGG